jgi:16S rRNA (guanine966-N2)-methyltransferase
MKLRIIAGKFGGQQFNAPPGHRTHPMGDRVRGALFNTLGDIEDLCVLDAYAGSGALAFEALSRGAKNTILIDNDKRAFQTILANIAALTLEHLAKVTQAPLHSWLENNPEHQFDLVLADPPYDDVQINTIVELADVVKEGGLLVLSWPVDDAVPTLSRLELVSSKAYAGAQLAFYRKTG